MTKPRNEYKRLRDIWYAKLAKDGFEDIEDKDSRNLKKWSVKLVLHVPQVAREAREQYYRMATDFLNDYKFKSSLEKIIWEYHANGMGVRDIADTLKKAKVIVRTAAWVHKFVIKPLRAEMKKMYMKNE